MEYNITYRQKDKGWQFIISYKNNGKWKQKSKQGFATKKEAKPVAEKMALQLSKQLNNSTIDDSYSSITFKQLSNIYIEHIALYRENNTLESYKHAINKFDELSNIKVKDIKKIHIQKIVDMILKKDTIKPKTIETYLQRIKMILKYYVEYYDPSYIVFDKIKLPNEKSESTKKALTKNQLDELLKTLKKEKYGRYYIAALIAGTCGLRCGEILGLTWNDINFKENEIYINKQWKLNKNTKKHDFGKLKGKKSFRVVPLPTNTKIELLEYKKIAIPDIHDRIVPCASGSIKRFLNPTLRELANISIHELRHTYATLLISSGIDFKTTAKFLGHDVQQTMKTYSHVTDDMVKKATDTISKIF